MDSKLTNYNDLKKAIELCRSVGYEVVDKSSIRKLSYNIANNRDEYDLVVLGKEKLFQLNEAEAFKSILNQLKHERLIKFSERKYEGPMRLDFKTWELKVLDY